MKKLFLFVFTLILIFGCKDSDAASESPKIMSINLPVKEDRINKTESYQSDEESKNKEISETPDQEVIDPQIIKNAVLNFETSDLLTTYNQVLTSVKKYDGNIQSDTEGKNDESLYRNLIIRIPSKNFDLFLSNATLGVDYFDRKEITSTDVTEEYVDVITRIKTKKILEQRYLELLKKASKVSEMLEIEAQIAAIREEIEAKEGRLKFIKNRVSQSTIELSFYKVVASESGETKSFGGKIGNAISSGFNGISTFFIGIVYMWPFILILVVLIYFIRKRSRKKSEK